MSGCINAAVTIISAISVFSGVDKDGSEFYQVSIGGAQGNNASIGKIIGPSFSAGQMPEVIERIVQVYLKNVLMPNVLLIPLCVSVSPRLKILFMPHQSPPSYIPVKMRVRSQLLKGSMMREIIKDRAIVQDDWSVLRLNEGETPEAVSVPAGKVIVPLAVWHAPALPMQRLQASRNRRLAGTGSAGRTDCR
jgi:hypothetical protein